MPRMLKMKGIAAIALIALVASAAVRVASSITLSLREQEEEDSQREMETRKLTHGQPLPASSSSIIIAKHTNKRRPYRSLQDTETPGTLRFERIMKKRVTRRQAALTKNQQRRNVIRNLIDAKDMSWHSDNSGNFLRSSKWHTAEAAGSFEENQGLDIDYEPLTVCDRPADVGSIEDFTSLQNYASCTEITKDKPILILQGSVHGSFGRTGNNLIEFLHAIQDSRDNDMQLGIMQGSWAMSLLLNMWMAVELGDDWQTQLESAFCVKIFDNPSELQGYTIIEKDTKRLFYYRSQAPLNEYMDSQENAIRSLFRNYNSGGEGGDGSPIPGQDMCSSIDAIFREDRTSAVYTVIHSRFQEGAPGLRLLKRISHMSRCDPVAALEMRPDYIKSILEPLGMLNYPIVIITDGQNPEVVQRLKEDPDLGPLIQDVPAESSWIGGDITIAVMSNVFIGNPASSFTGFIAKARLALGFGHNYLFRAKDENNKWSNVCGDHCIFDKKILGAMS